MRTQRWIGGLTALLAALWAPAALASEATLVMPTFTPEQRTMLIFGMGVCVLGVIFGAQLGHLCRVLGQLCRTLGRDTLALFLGNKNTVLA